MRSKKKAISPQQLQTQKKYVEEKGKGQRPVQPKQTKETKEKKPAGGFKKWLLKSLNFPEEAIAESDQPMRKKIVDLSNSKNVEALTKRATSGKEKSVMPTRRRRRSRLGTESKLNREHNRTYDLPNPEDSPEWIEDDYTDRAEPYGMKENMPVNKRESRFARRRRIRAAIRRAQRNADFQAFLAERGEDRSVEAGYQEEYAPRRRQARLEEDYMPPRRRQARPERPIRRRRRRHVAVARRLPTRRRRPMYDYE